MSNLLDDFSRIIADMKDNSANWRPVDPHDLRMFSDQYGPALARIGPYVIYTESDAKDLNYGREVYRLLKEMMEKSRNTTVTQL